MDIHITRKGEKHGPYPEATARQFLEEGKLLPTDLAWHEGAEGWKPLSEVLGVAAQPPATPPSPPRGGIPKRTMAGAAPAEEKQEDSEAGDPDQIKVTRKGEPIGPYSREKAKEYFASGQLLPTDWGWHDGMDDWKPINEVLGMAAPAQTTAAAGQIGNGANGKYSKIIKIAKLQKRIMWVLLAGLIISLLSQGASKALQQAMLSGGGLGTALTSIGISLVILLAAIAILILQIVTLVQLRNAIGAGVAGTVLCCLLQCVPLVSLIVLALASQKATEMLKGQGYTVGFMGISRAALKELKAKN